MKKLVCMLLAVLFIFSIAGCASKGETADKPEEDTLSERGEDYNDGNPFYSDEIGKDTAKRMLSNFVATGAFGELKDVFGFKFEYLKDAKAEGYDCYIYKMLVIKEKGGDYVFYKNVAIDKKGSCAFIYGD